MHILAVFAVLVLPILVGALHRSNVVVRYLYNVGWGCAFLIRALIGRYVPHPGNYWLNVLLGLDQFANALAGGDPRETISSRSAKARSEGRSWGCIMCAFLGWVATKLSGQPTDHCALSLNKKVGGDAVVPD